MVTHKKPMRDKDERILIGIINTLSTKGRLKALVDRKKITQEALDKLNKLEKEEKKEATKELLQKVKALRGLWEGHHLLEYATTVRSRLGNPRSPGNPLNRALEAQRLPDGFKWVQRIPSELTVGSKNARKLFDAVAEVGALAKAQKISQKISLLECLLDFLKFCKDKEYSLEVFNYQEEGLIEAINDITDYLNDEQENSSATEDLSESQANNKALAGFSIRWENGTCKIDEKPGEQYLRRPNFSDNLSLDNVATLLDWQYHLAPFIGREQQLRQLHDWLDSPSDRSIQLIYGDGGAGKTRLAFHFVQEILEKGWQAGQPDRNIAGNWVGGDKGVLLIIDYPEERALYWSSKT